MHCLVINYQPLTLFGLSSLIKMVFPAWQLTSAVTTDAALAALRSSLQPVDMLILYGTNADDELETLLKHARHANLAHPVLRIVFPTRWDQHTRQLCEQYESRVCLCNIDNVVNVIESIKSAASDGECRCNFQARQIYPRAQISLDVAAPQLSPRQSKLAELVLAGYANKEIADRLDLTHGTVKNYMSELMRLLKVSSRLELASHLRQVGFGDVQLRTPSVYPAR